MDLGAAVELAITVGFFFVLAGDGAFGRPRRWSGLILPLLLAVAATSALGWFLHREGESWRASLRAPMVAIGLAALAVVFRNAFLWRRYLPRLEQLLRERGPLDEAGVRAGLGAGPGIVRSVLTRAAAARAVRRQVRLASIAVAPPRGLSAKWERIEQLLRAQSPLESADVSRELAMPEGSADFLLRYFERRGAVVATYALPAKPPA